jgi:hypothetical protein
MRRKLAAGIVLVVAAPAPGLGQQVIVVPAFTTSLTEAEAGDLSLAGVTRGLSDLLLTDLVKLIDSDPAFQKCGAHVMEYERIDEVLKEREFQQSKYVDPTTRSEGDLLEPNRFVKGHVSAAGEGVAWMVEMRGPFGQVALVLGEGSLEDLAGGTAEIARQLLEKACKPRPVRIEAGLNDLQLDDVVCDVSKPFSVRGAGQTAGIRFDMEPADAEEGAFTLTGTAAGVTWSGVGVYRIMEIEGRGAIALEGAWQLQSPMGTFGTTELIMGTVTPVEQDCP